MGFRENLRQEAIAAPIVSKISAAVQLLALGLAIAGLYRIGPLSTDHPVGGTIACLVLAWWLFRAGLWYALGGLHRLVYRAMCRVGMVPPEPPPPPPKPRLRARIGGGIRRLTGRYRK